jgi:hypothetical protein
MCTPWARPKEDKGVPMHASKAYGGVELYLHSVAWITYPPPLAVISVVTP